MAQRVNVELVDDIDGGTAAETVTFGIDGATYEIDLSDKNAKKLRDSFATYIGHARKVGRATGRAGRRAHVGPDPAAVRAWAKSAGKEVPERGRIPKALVDEFMAAHG